MRTTRLAQNIVLGIIAVLGAASLAFVALVLGFGLRPAEVMSGSMLPTLPVGSVVLTTQVPASQLKAGDVVQVPRGGDASVVTHRIQTIEKTDAGYAVTLKGDANKKADPQPYLITSAGLMKADVPYLGYAASWIKAYPVYAALILLGLLVFAFWGRSKVTVVLPNGHRIDGLTTRDARTLVAAYEAEHNVPADDRASTRVPDDASSLALLDLEPGAADTAAADTAAQHAAHRA